MGNLRSETLVHGENAWGAKYMVRGFTRSPETDLLYAVGFPHLRRLVVGHPDEALAGDALREKILSPYGPDIPAAFAARRVRAQAVFIPNPDFSWRKEALEALEDDSPFTPESAREFIANHLARREFGGAQADVAYTLEALVGADTVAQAVVDAFEAKTNEELASDRNPGWGAYLPIILLRTSKAVGDALVPRIEKIIERGLSAPQVFAVSVAAHLDKVFHGHRPSAGRRGSTLFFSELVWWSDAPKDVLEQALRSADINKWDFAPEPRLAMLCPDAVIDVYRARWNVLKDADDQRRLVEWFGDIVHPGIAPLITDMAEKSKAKKAARAWLAAQSGGADAPAAGEAKKAPKKKAAKAAPAAPAKLAVPALDPDAIAAAFDAGVKGNDWPSFFELDPEDVLHGMRIVAVRAGRDWGVAIERLQGDSPASLLTRTWLFGSANPGEQGYRDEPISFCRRERRGHRAERLVRPEEGQRKEAEVRGHRARVPRALRRRSVAEHRDDGEAVRLSGEARGRRGERRVRARAARVGRRSAGPSERVDDVRLARASRRERRWLAVRAGEVERLSADDHRRCQYRP